MQREPEQSGKSALHQRVCLYEMEDHSPFIICSQNGNHASIYTTGATAEEADTKLMGALNELKLIPETSIKDVQ
jgi:hypothetical protein